MRPQKYILSTLIIIIILSGIIYAISYPINLPEGQTSWWSLSLRLANIIGSCPVNTFLKGFDLSFNRICVPSSGTYSWPAIVPPAAPSGYPSTPPAGQYVSGKMGTYFNNLRGICPGNKIIKGFATDGFKYCVDPASSAIYTPHTSQISSGISWPTTPGGQDTWGKFQTFFTNMFTICTWIQVVNGFNTNGSPICINNIQTIACWWSVPTNAIASTTDTYIQTWNGSIWAPTTNWWESQSTCDFNCTNETIWNWTKCATRQTLYFDTACYETMWIEYCSQAAANAFCVYKWYTSAASWWMWPWPGQNKCPNGCDVGWFPWWNVINCDGYWFWHCERITCERYK